MSAPNPPPAPVLDETRRAVQRIVGGAVGRGEVPGAVAVVGTSSALAAPFAAGVLRLGGPPVTPETRFDLASLTKVVATLPAVLRLASDGLLDLDAPLKEPFPNAGWFRTPSLGDRTARDLLTHTSGLPAWAPLMGLVSTRRTALGHALASDLPHEHGEVVYSDLGFMVLGALVERAAGVRQDAFVRDRIVRPLGLDAADLGYRPLGAFGDDPSRENPSPDGRSGGDSSGEGASSRGASGELDAASIAATEACGWRDRLLQGEVHDEGAWIMGGVAGHAGLFGTATAVARYAQAWLRQDERLADPALLRHATRRATAPGQPARGLGWVLAADAEEGGGGARDAAGARVTDGGGRGGPDADPPDEPGADPRSATRPDATPSWRGPRGYGHKGFTGTSLWIDPDKDRLCVLLTNRVHPTRHGGHGIARLRHDVHAAVFGGGAGADRSADASGGAA